MSWVGGVWACLLLAGPPVYHAKDSIFEQPAHLAGPDADLTIRAGVLSGRLDGGAYRVSITPDSARGTGPMGPIDVRLKRQPDGYHVRGVWNGGDVNVVLGLAGMRGTMMTQIDGDRGYRSCHYDLTPLGHDRGYSGIARCLGVEHPLRYEVRPRLQSDVTEEQNVILLLAYFAAPPEVFNF
jgi:hypothetical protein